MPGTAAKNVGAHIFDLRTSRGWSQQRLATAIGKHQGVLSRWELGHRSIDVDNLQLIATALQVPMAQFFTEPNTNPKLTTAVLTNIADQLETITTTIRSHTT